MLEIGKWRTFLTWMLVSGLATAALAARQDEFIEVEAKELVKNPQLYWAQGVIFKDVMVQPPEGPARKIGEHQVVSFRTKAAGECFADEELAGALRNVKPGSECFFSGTVFQEQRTFSSSFRILVQKFTASVPDLKNASEIITNMARVGDSAYARTARQLDFVLSRIQGELIAYSSEKNLSLAELFDPASPHRERLLEFARRGINQLEDESRAPSSAFLADLLVAMLAESHRQPVPPPAATNAPALKPDLEDAGTKGDEPKVESAPKVEAPSADKPAGEKRSAAEAGKPAQQKKSFFGRLFGSGSGKSTNTAAKATAPAPRAAGEKTGDAKPAENRAEVVAKPADEKEAAVVTGMVSTNSAGAAAPAAAPAPKKKSFWGRLFGGGEKSPPAPKPPEAAAPKTDVTTNAAPAAAGDASKPLPER